MAGASREYLRAANSRQVRHLASVSVSVNVSVLTNPEIMKNSSTPKD
jgi:hypothetical protein